MKFRTVINHSFVRNFSFMTGPEIVNIFLKFFVGIITAKILGPENLGLTVALGMIFTYSTLLQLGVSDGAGLKIYALNANPNNKPVIKGYYNTAYHFINNVLLIVSILFFAIISFQKYKTIIWVGIIANIAAAFLYQRWNYTLAWTRFSWEFKKYSKVILFDYIIKAALCIIFTYYFRLSGFFLALFCGFLISVIYAHTVVKPPFENKINYNYLKEMLILGFPLIIIGSFFTLYQTIDRWFILAYLDIKQLGYYSIITGFVAVLLMITITTVSLTMQYSLEYYFKTKDKEVLSKGFMQLSSLLLIVYLTLIILTKEFMFYLFKYYLVKYQYSYQIAGPVLISVYFICLFHVVGAFFTVIDKKRYTLICLGIGLAGMVAYNFISMYTIRTLIGVAYAITAASLTLAFAILVFFFYTHNLSGKNLRDFILVLFVVLLSHIITELYFPHDFNAVFLDNLAITFIKGFVCSLVSLSLFYYLFKVNKLPELKKIYAR